MDYAARDRLTAELDAIREQGLYKTERVITTPQSSAITTSDGREVLNFCANNYLGLADNAEIIAAAKAALDSHGFGLASVRFICGTQDLHKQLEAAISRFFGTDDTILYTSCFDANGGLFETILSDEDAVISDALNHASIIDGIRLCKAERRRYANGDMAELEKHLAAGARRVILTVPAKDEIDGTVVVGVNDGDLTPAHRIVSGSGSGSRVYVQIAMTYTRAAAHTRKRPMPNPPRRR